MEAESTMLFTSEGSCGESLKRLASALAAGSLCSTCRSANTGANGDVAWGADCTRPDVAGAPPAGAELGGRERGAGEGEEAAKVALEEGGDVVGGAAGLGAVPGGGGGAGRAGRRGFAGTAGGPGRAEEAAAEEEIGDDAGETAGGEGAATAATGAGAGAGAGVGRFAGGGGRIWCTGGGGDAFTGGGGA